MAKLLNRIVVWLMAMSLMMTKGIAQTVRELVAANPDWSKPYEPFRIAGNLYYVGTYDLGCYLITTSKGNILINTGLESSDTLIKNNIEKLGFRFSETKILLTTQAHFDHVGAMAAIKQETGAQLMIDEGDALVVKDGGMSDVVFGGQAAIFKPMNPDRLLHDGDTIKLGDMQLVMLHHPGHTRGSCSYLFTVKDNQRSYSVLIANMPTIVVTKRFSEISDYLSMPVDYYNTFVSMKKISFDIWLASHANQFKLHNKHKPGDRYNPDAFVDKTGYLSALGELEKAYMDKMKNE